MGYEVKIIDPNVSTATNVFLVIANIINFIYNVPQVVKTYKTRSTQDFSATFLFLRVVGNLIWVAYSFEVESLMLLLNNGVTVLASVFIAYYKIIELLDKRKNKQEDSIPLSEDGEPSA